MSHKLSMCQGLTFIYWNWYNDLTVSQPLRKGLCYSFSGKYNWTQVPQRLNRILNCTWIPECVTRFCFHRMALEHSPLVHRRGNYLRDFMKLCDTHCTNVLLLGCWEKNHVCLRNHLGIHGFVFHSARLPPQLCNFNRLQRESWVKLALFV